MPPIALDLTDITVAYQPLSPDARPSRPALDHCTLRVSRTECVGVVGAPGSGKTSLLLCASGILRPDAGRVVAPRAAYASRSGTSHPYLGVRAALDFSVTMLELSGWTGAVNVEDVLARTSLAAYARVRIGQLAPSLRVRVSVAQALLTAPRLLCLDDFFDDLDERGRREVGVLLDSLRAEGIATVASAASPDALSGVATRTVAMSRGRLENHAAGGAILELDVALPARAALALARRLPSVHRRDRALRVSLERVSAEEVLSTCVALGIEVQGSRVLDASISSAAPGVVDQHTPETTRRGRVAEGGAED